MTQVISRLYEDETRALSVAERLRFEGLPPRAIRIITLKTGEAKSDLTERLTRINIASDTAPKYASHIAAGKAAVVVDASFKPLGAAKITRNVLGRNDPIDLGEAIEEVYVPDKPGEKVSVLDSHPLFLTTPVRNRRFSSGGPISHGLGPKLLMKQRPRTSAIRGGKFMSKAFWPMALLKKTRSASSAIRGGKHMSRMFWPQPLLSSKKRRLSVIPGGALPFSRTFGFKPLI